VLRDSITNFTYNCSNPLLCSSTSALSSELALSQYGETLLADIFTGQNILIMGLMERLEEICSYLFENNNANI